MEPLRAFIRELVKRRVLRTAGIYLVAVWGVSQGAADLFPLFGASEDDVRLFILAALALLPAVVTLAWRYDITGQGVKRAPADVRPGRAVSPAAEETVSLSLDGAPRECVRIEVRDGAHDDFALQARDFVIGRDEGCAVRFEDLAVSRSHARVFHRDGRWMIRDLGSTNGTWLDGERMREACLPAACNVRVNEAGPALRLSLVSAEALRAGSAHGLGQTLRVRRRSRGRAGSPPHGA